MCELKDPTATIGVRMFEEYQERVVDLRRAGQELAACVRLLEETDLTSDSGVAVWLQELDRAASAGGEAMRQARELQTAIASAWPRRLSPGWPRLPSSATTAERSRQASSAEGQGSCAVPDPVPTRNH
jgi:hypothetical protein